MRCVTTMDNKQLTKLISYFAMGDGGLYRRVNAKGYLLNAQFIMNMKEENRDYIEWVSETVKNLTSVRIYERKDYNTDGCTRKPQLRLESNCHPELSKLHERIYTEDGHKGLDLHTLKLLDWESLAILFMCDGNSYEYLREDVGMKNPSVNVTLNLKRLSEAEQLVLKQAIRDKLGIEFNINKAGKYWCLRLRARDVNTFMDGIEPYMKDSFKYKIIRMKSPVKTGGDIVCSAQECVETYRNDESSYD